MNINSFRQELTLAVKSQVGRRLRWSAVEMQPLLGEIDHLTAERDALKARVEEMRPEVRAFAALMERELRANDHKGGWRDCTMEYLFDKLAEEYIEFLQAVVRKDKPGTASEGADLANIVMMICDVLGQLAQTPQLEREVKGGDIGKEVKAGHNGPPPKLPPLREIPEDRDPRKFTPHKGGDIGKEPRA